jgi:thiamine kinase-like enzyme
MKKFPPIKKGGGFKSFFKKMKSHVEKTPIFHEIIPLLKNKYSYFNSGTIETFCHGDFSIENILFDKNGKVYLIDPIVEGWNHWLLDLSKLVFSLRFNRMELAAEHVYATYNYVGGLSYIITLLEACQWVRVYKYAPENKKKIIIDGYIEVMKRLECLR